MYKSLSYVFLGMIIAIIFLTTCSQVKADTLTWDINTDATSYVVYQKVDGEADALYKQVSSTTVPLTGTTFTLPLGELNKTYNYAVKAFSVCGNSSDFSDPVKYNRCLTSIISKVLNSKITIQPTGR